MTSQSDAVDELRCDEGGVVSASDFVDSQDVRVVERGGGFGFLDETFDAALLGGDVVGEEFEGDWAAKFGVLCSVHLAHTACTYFGDDAITANSSTGGKFCHWRGFTLVRASAQEERPRTGVDDTFSAVKNLCADLSSPIKASQTGFTSIVGEFEDEELGSHKSTLKVSAWGSGWMYPQAEDPHALYVILGGNTGSTKYDLYLTIHAPRAMQKASP